MFALWPWVKSTANTNRSCMCWPPSRQGRGKRGARAPHLPTHAHGCVQTHVQLSSDRASTPTVTFFLTTAIEARVARSVDLAPTADAQRAEDFVVAEPRSPIQRHRRIVATPSAGSGVEDETLMALQQDPALATRDGLFRGQVSRRLRPRRFLGRRHGVPPRRSAAAFATAKRLAGSLPIAAASVPRLCEGPIHTTGSFSDPWQLDVFLPLRPRGRSGRLKAAPESAAGHDGLGRRHSEATRSRFELICRAALSSNLRKFREVCPRCRHSKCYENWRTSVATTGDEEAHPWRSQPRESGGEEEP